MTTYTSYLYRIDDDNKQKIDFPWLHASSNLAQYHDQNIYLRLQKYLQYILPIEAACYK